MYVRSPPTSTPCLTFSSLKAIERPEAFKWASRHTYQSWRDRYYKNQEYFNPIIERIAAREKPTKKQIWKEDRRRGNGKYGRMFRHEREKDDDDSEGEEEEVEIVEDEDFEHPRRATRRGGSAIAADWGEEYQQQGNRRRRSGLRGGSQREYREEFDLTPENIRLLRQEEEEEGEEELSPLKEKKRRRSERQTRVSSTSQPRKKARISPASAKGKEKAISEDEVGEDEEFVFFVSFSNLQLNVLSRPLFSGDYDVDIYGPDENPYQDFNEPGPSNSNAHLNSPPSPDRTLAEPASRNRRGIGNTSRPSPPIRPPSPGPGFRTQDTLVNTISVPRQRQDDTIFEPASHSTSANRVHSANTTRLLPAGVSGRELEQPPTVEERQPGSWPELSPSPTPPPPAPQPRRSTRVVVEIPSPAKKPRGSPEKRQPQRQPKPSFEAPKRAARRPPSMMRSPPPERYEAPYRNTRSRSRSAEPTQSRPKPKPKVKKVRKEVIPEEDEDVRMNEAGGEADREQEEVPSLPETIEEERDVEQLLTAEDPNQSARSGSTSVAPAAVRGGNVGNSASAGASGGPRTTSIDTDDAQTRQNLRPNTGSVIPQTMLVSRTVAQQRTFTSNRIRPDEILQMYAASSRASSIAPAPIAPRQSLTPNIIMGPPQGIVQPRPLLSRNTPMPRQAGPTTGARPRQSESGPRSMTRTRLDAGAATSAFNSPRTPVNVLSAKTTKNRDRRASDSSGDSFPPPGTRASAVKNYLQQQEKHSPFKPYEGTRAAQVAKSR